MSSRAEEPVDVLLVCTAGGHLLQLWSLRESWRDYEHAWVVGSHGGGDVESLLAGERIHYAHSPAARSLKNAVRNLWLAWRLVEPETVDRPQQAVEGEAAGPDGDDDHRWGKTAPA